MNRLDLGERIDLWHGTYRCHMAIRIVDRLQPGALDIVRCMAAGIPNKDRRYLVWDALNEVAR